jgi:cytochrome P450
MAFDPYRFIDRRPEPYTFLPFIEGPRNCLGQNLALLESKMVLGLLLQRYDLEVEEAIQTQLHGDLEQDPRHRYMVPVCPKKDINIKVKRKKP